MNQFHAKAVFERGAWRARVRYVHKADYIELPEPYGTKAEAEIAALRHQEHHINSTLTGFRADFDLQSEIEKVFGKGRQIEVETKRKRA